MIDIGSTIMLATEAIALAPKVADLFNKSKEVFGELQNLKMEEAEMPPILVKVITNEQKRLNELTDEYYKVASDPTADTIEKKNAQLRIAAKICQLLTSISPLKESISGYDIIKEMYCSSVPEALKA